MAFAKRLDCGGEPPLSFALKFDDCKNESPRFGKMKFPSRRATHLRARAELVFFPN
jgi:hypothetical protein